MREETEKPRSKWSSRPAPAPAKVPPPPPPDTRVQDAKNALQSFWSTAGDLGAGEAADACRKLSADELKLVRAWIPSGQGLTAQKCEWAFDIVTAVIEEKK